MSSKKLSASVRGAVRKLAVVFGDQLDQRATLLAELDRDDDAVLMVEVEEEATHVASHKQRTALFLAAMRHFALDLVERGFRVRYVKLDSTGNSQSFSGEVARATRILDPDELAVTHPGEWRVRDLVASWREELDRPVRIYPDEHFSATLEQFADWADGRKQLVMEYFYREQRRKLDVLVDDEKKPAGGKWNFDRDNRETFDASPDPPRPYRARTDSVTDEVIALVKRRFPDAPGDLESFHWPVTRDQAQRALSSFIEDRLASFGRYQDAMWSGEPWLYHSMLSPCLNLKLLSVKECVEAALEALEAGKAPLNSVEGFIRQLIGWREFLRGVYWHEGRDYRTRNALDQHGALPEFYWNGQTDMNCLRECLGQVIQHGYGHHIQRLMVTGNFALLSGVHPRAIADWYLGMYVDGVDWVTTPNTIGMVMHADDGIVGTKPYAASGQYIRRMSNYCDDCRYDPARRAGEEDDSEGDDAPPCPFTTLYWDFLLRNRQRFRSNHRMALVLKNVDRIDDDEARRIRKQARQLRDEYGIAPITRS